MRDYEHSTAELIPALRQRRLDGFEIALDGFVFSPVGLVSALDALFERPLERIVRELPLSPEVQAAALEQRGLLGEILVDVLSHESDDAVQTTRFELGMLNRAWLDALIWAGDAVDALV